MRLIKIGSSPASDIVLNSKFVSAHHAELTLLDNGDIILEDKESKNGTFVGGRQIAPNEEIPVKKGDFIRFADVELQWSQVPSLNLNKEKYKAIYNIGTNFHNEIILNGNYVSRFHAALKIARNGQAYLSDSGSKNGTKVNGVLIKPNQDVRISRKDIITFADVDTTQQLRPYLPPPFPWLKVAVAAVVTLLIGLSAFLFFFGEPCGVCGERFCKGHSPQDFRPAVVYVNAHYHYVIQFEDNPISSQWNGLIEINFATDNIDLGHYEATAFFIDREGRMATNRHVAIPWDEEYRNPAETEYIKQRIEDFKQQLVFVNDEDDLRRLRNVSIRDIKGLKEIGLWLIQSSTNVKELNLKINRIRNSQFTISGVSDFITVGYPGRYYTHLDELDRCYLLSESGSPDKDIAILQLNDKKTPEKIKYIFDVNNFYTETLEPLKDRLYTIGYPKGTNWALDNKTHSLEPGIRETVCSKMPSRYTFEIQGEAVGGASGSPIFNQKGQLVGILWGGWSAGATYGLACQAKYLKEMYNKEMGYE